GDDYIDGGNGNDTIIGGKGDAYLTGGGGWDRFVFEDGFGHDHIFDFQAGEHAWDLLDFSGVSSVTSLGDLTRDQWGSDAKIWTPDGDMITLVNVHIDWLADDDFLFA